MSFLQGADKNVWVWVMGEHPKDQSIEEKLEEERQRKAEEKAEAEVANFRGKDMIFTTDKPYEFDRILVTLNGPDIKCDVPVYVFAMD